MASDTFSSNTGTVLNLYCEWNSTANPATNSSTVNLAVYLKYYSINVGARYGNNIAFDGSVQPFDTPAIYNMSNTPHSTLIAVKTWDNIKHDANGQKQAYLSASWRFNGTYNGVYIDWISVGRQVTLDTIPQTAPTISSRSVMNVSQTGARLNMAASHVTGIKTYSFSVGGQFKSGGQTYQDFGGLTPNTDYIARFTAIAGNGKATDGANINFKTLPIYISSITQPSVTLELGKNQMVNPTILPSNASIKTLSYTSSNPNVAIYSGGQVVSVGVGQATITARATDGSGKSISFQVNVIQPVTGLTVDAQNIELPVSMTYPINATVLPANAHNKALSYQSEDPSIATVDANGIIRGIGSGETGITVKTVDRGYSVTIVVRVGMGLTWNELDKLSAGQSYDFELPRKVQQNLLFLYDALKNTWGYDVESLELIDFSQGHDQSLTGLNTPETIINTLERNIDRINEAIDWLFKEYEEHKEFHTVFPMRDDVNRWVSISQELKYVIDRIKPRNFPLYWDEGCPTFWEDEEPIYVGYYMDEEMY